LFRNSEGLHRDKGRKAVTKEEERLDKVRELMEKLTPLKVKLEVGSIIRLDEDLIAEKTPDGRIIIYEVVKRRSNLNGNL